MFDSEEYEGGQTTLKRPWRAGLVRAEPVLDFDQYTASVSVVLKVGNWLCLQQSAHGEVADWGGAVDPDMDHSARRTAHRMVDEKLDIITLPTEFKFLGAHTHGLAMNYNYLLEFGESRIGCQPVAMGRSPQNLSAMLQKRCTEGRVALFESTRNVLKQPLRTEATGMALKLYRLNQIARASV